LLTRRLQSAVCQNIVDDILNAIRAIIIRLYARAVPIEYHSVRFFSILLPDGQTST
jgi:hypothetical protein